MPQCLWFITVSWMKRFLMWPWLQKKRKIRTELNSKKTKNKPSKKSKSKDKKSPKDCTISLKRMQTRLSFNLSSKSWPKTKKEKPKSKPKNSSPKLWIYPLKSESTCFVQTTLALIKKLPKVNDNSWSTLDFISRSHGKAKSINFCTKTCRHKSTTNSSILMFQWMT